MRSRLSLSGVLISVFAIGLVPWVVAVQPSDRPRSPPTSA
jgi:hypothetical protein